MAHRNHPPTGSRPPIPGIIDAPSKTGKSKFVPPPAVRQCPKCRKMHHNGTPHLYEVNGTLVRGTEAFEKGREGLRAMGRAVEAIKNSDIITIKRDQEVEIVRPGSFSSYTEELGFKITLPDGNTKILSAPIGTKPGACPKCFVMDGLDSKLTVGEAVVWHDGGKETTFSWQVTCACGWSSDHFDALVRDKELILAGQMRLLREEIAKKPGDVNITITDSVVMNSKVGVFKEEEE